jgi:hypothetical protein
VSSIFANPATGYTLNPSWSGVDSVPAGAVALPAPFSDSTTDLVGDPRVLNGVGTCVAGLRDKGAAELIGHSGAVPEPIISGPATVSVGANPTYKATVSNAPSGGTFSFSWQTSDGGGGTGASLTHKFTQPAKQATVSITATGAAGCVGTNSFGVKVLGPDVISNLSVTPHSFKAAASGTSLLKRARRGSGATISYRGSAPATTTFTVQRRRGGRFVTVGAFEHTDALGQIRLHFSGRLGGHKLAIGSYRLKLIPSSPAGHGRASISSFTIKG